MRTLSDNPLVLRAFRVGFRSGGFRMGLWGTLLFILLALITAAHAVEPEFNAEGYCRSIVIGLVYFSVASFVLGGFQRTLASFAQERERGTIEFLQLSSLKPFSMIFGFLFAGQLPGYLFLLFTLPVMLICAVVSHLHVGYLLLLILVLVGYVVVYSILLMLFGFWMRRVADLRTGALLLFLLGAAVLSIATWVMSQQNAGYAGVPGWVPHGVLGLLAVYPVLAWVWARVRWSSEYWEVEDPMGRLEALDTLPVGFFEMPWSEPLHALVFFAPITAIAAFCLSNSLRHRERRPISNPWILALMGWVIVYFTATYWGPVSQLAGQPGYEIAAGRKVFILSVIVFLTMAFLVIHRSVRTTPSMARVVFRGLAPGSGGGLLRTILHRQSPPYWAVGAACAMLVIGNWVQGIATSESIPAIPLLTVALSIYVYFLMSQFLEWRRFGRLAWLWAYQLGAVWAPFVIYSVVVATDGNFGLFAIPTEPLRGACMVSPLLQVLVLAPGASPQWLVDLQGDAGLGPERVGAMVVVGLTFMTLIALAIGHGARLTAVRRSLGAVVPNEVAPNDASSPEDGAEPTAS